MTGGHNPEFDFWLGRWAIRQRVRHGDGSWREYVGRTEVAPHLDGRVLVEHWEGTVCLPWEGMTAPEPRKGFSVRAFDPAAGRWNIYWMDTRNLFFGPTYSGAFAGGRGEFFGDEDDGTGGKVRGRITFADVAAGSVRWEFALADGAGGWLPIWVMDMTREPEVYPASAGPARVQMRPSCECCDRDLPPAAPDARICSFECTFCAGCADGVLGGRCPNCGGELVRRPARPEPALARFPASTRRVVKADGCVGV